MLSTKVCVVVVCLWQYNLDATINYDFVRCRDLERNRGIYITIVDLVRRDGYLASVNYGRVERDRGGSECLHDGSAGSV